jgi:glutamate synthase domain-containing protein 3
VYECRDGTVVNLGRENDNFKEFMEKCKFYDIDDKTGTLPKRNVAETKLIGKIRKVGKVGEY